MIVKYPRTFHLPWSPGISDDDEVLNDLSGFRGHEVVLTEKMDGENCTMYTDRIHARSLDSAHHESRSWVKNFWSSIKHKIPIRWRICGENMYAQHSIAYDSLQSYFYGFSIWDEYNICQSWRDTLTYFELLGIVPVRQVYINSTFIEDEVKEICENVPPNVEGYVLRRTDSFRFDEFTKYVAKYVRKNHVQTNEHWMTSKIIPNKLGGIINLNV
jgi:hypothetical protein